MFKGFSGEGGGVLGVKGICWGVGTRFEEREFTLDVHFTFVLSLISILALGSP